MTTLWTELLPTATIKFLTASKDVITEDSRAQIHLVLICGSPRFIDTFVLWIIRSFIHSYRYLYSTPSRLLLRSAPDSNAPKEDSLQIRIERLRMNPNDAKESPFQTERPTIQKSRFCLVEIWANEQKACSAPHSSNCGWGGGYEARRQVLGLMWGEGTVGKISSKGN